MDPQGIQCHFHFVYSPLQPLDTSGRASARGKAADAGQRRALEREAEQATVDAASPDHLEPPPCASRGASTSATRHHAGPLLPLSVLPMPRVPRAARARQCACELVAPPGARPAPSLSSWRPTPPPRAPKTTPRSLPLPPEPLPRPPVRRVHGEPRVGYLRPAPSPLSTPLALSPSRAFPGPIRTSSRALQPRPWPEPSRRPPPKFSSSGPPPPHLWVTLHLYCPRGAPPHSGYSSRRPERRARHRRRPRPPRTTLSLTRSSPACV